MIGFAANDATKRDDAIIGRAGLLRDVEGDCDGWRDLQRAGNFDQRRLGAKPFQRRQRALAQQLNDIVIEPRRYNENLRARHGRGVIVGA